MVRIFWGGQLDWSRFGFIEEPEKQCFMKREFNKLLLKPNIVSDSQLTKDEKVFEEDINLFNRWNSASHTLQMVSQTNQSIHEIPD